MPELGELGRLSRTLAAGSANLMSRTGRLDRW